MKAQLILVDDCASCKDTEALWRELSDAYGITLEVLNLDEQEGEALANRLNLNTFPALVVSGRVRAVGAPNRASAHRVLEEVVPERRPHS